MKTYIGKNILLRVVLPKAPRLILNTICLYYLVSSSPRWIETIVVIIKQFFWFRHNNTGLVAIIDGKYFVSKGSVPTSV